MILLHEQLQVFKKNHENKVFPNLPVHTNELLHYLCPVFTEIYELDRTLAWGIVLLRHKKTKRVMRTLKIVPFIEESTHALFEKEVYWLKTIAHKKISPKVFRITNDSDMYVNITEQFGVFAIYGKYRLYVNRNDKQICRCIRISCAYGRLFSLCHDFTNTWSFTYRFVSGEHCYKTSPKKVQSTPV